MEYAGATPLYIGGIDYRFHQSREIEGTIKTLTLKRIPTGRFFVFSRATVAEAEPSDQDGIEPQALILASNDF